MTNQVFEGVFSLVQGIFLFLKVVLNIDMAKWGACREFEIMRVLAQGWSHFAKCGFNESEKLAWQQSGQGPTIILSLGLCTTVYTTLPFRTYTYTLAQHYAIFLICLGFNQHRNPNINNKDHLVGQLTKSAWLLYGWLFGHMKPRWLQDISLEKDIWD